MLNNYLAIKKERSLKKGFTLIELLVVIAIIAVLSVVVILSLNPAELLRQARDSNRVSDMATLKSAVSLYLADVASPILGTAEKCYTSIATGTTLNASTSSSPGTPTPTLTDCSYWFVTQTPTGSFNVSSSRAIDGSGWVPVNLTAITSGAPIGSLPVDAVNTTGTVSATGYFYSFISSSTVFKLAAAMESVKYSNGGSNDAEKNDGGKNPYLYEQGTSLSL